MVGFVTHEKPGHIDQLCVAADAWGSGAAGVLLNAVKRLSGGSLTLEVNQDNPRAVRFYEREGFRRAGEGRNASSGLSTWRYEWVDISRVG
jgi:putative acetyltransferase